MSTFGLNYMLPDIAVAIFNSLSIECAMIRMR